jgi:hypothetical protein
MVIRHATVCIAAAFALGDCRMCHKDPPPVLFPGFEAGAVSTDAEVTADASVSVSEDGGALPRTTAERASGDRRTLVVDGVTVTAPEGALFEEFLTQDVDGDGDRDLVATVTRARGLSGVLFYARDEAAFVQGASANAEAPARGCVPAGLSAFSPKHWALRFERCGESQTADAGGAAAQPAPGTVFTEHLALFVDASGAATKLRVAELGPSLPSTRLLLDLAYADRDGDGRADVSVRVGAARASDSPDATAWVTVVLLDRGVGFARDTSEPAASIARLVAQARALGSTRRRAESALALIERAQRIRRALCVEAGAPRVRVGGELGLRCGSMFNGFAEAHARALLTAGELPAAEATQWPDTASEFGVVDSESFDRDLQRAAGSETGVGARSGPFIGSALDDWHVRASVFTLDPQSSPTHVSVRGPTHARVERQTFAIAPGEEGSPNELALRSPDGARVAVGAWQTCAGVVVAFCAASDASCAGAPSTASAPPAGATLVSLTDLPAPEFGARCLRQEASSEPVRRATELRVIGYAREGLVLAWRGRLYRAAGDATAFALVSGSPVATGFLPGSAATSDGRAVALQGADAVYVRDNAGRWRGWRPPTLSGRTRQLTDVTLSDDQRVIAGRLGTQLWLIERQ